MDIKGTLNFISEWYYRIYRVLKLFFWKLGAWLSARGPFSLLFSLLVTLYWLYKVEHLTLDKLIYVAIGGLGVIIALLSFYLNKTKVNLELFDRRFKIYEGCKQALEIVIQKGTIDFHAALELLKKYEHEAKFFYGEEIIYYIDSLYKKCVALDTTHRGLQDLAKIPTDSEERRNLSSKNRDLLIFLTEEYTKLPQVFSIYLSFKYIY